MCTDRQRRIQLLQLRHREGAWSAALGWLFDNADGSLSTLPGWLSRDAHETMDEAYARHIRYGDALVAQMKEARPAQAEALAARWAAWCTAQSRAGD
jgi:hypothetical protein